MEIRYELIYTRNRVNGLAEEACKTIGQNKGLCSRQESVPIFSYWSGIEGMYAIVGKNDDKGIIAVTECNNKVRHATPVISLEKTASATLHGKKESTCIATQNEHILKQSWQNDCYYSACETEAGMCLHLLGIKTKLSGFLYLRMAIATAAVRPSFALCNDIYPMLELMYGKNSKSIERSMRYAIESAWDSGCADAQYKMFGYTINADKGKPVVKEFVSMVAEHVRQNIVRANHA